MSERGAYTNYDHGDLGDETEGYDPDFNYPHLDQEGEIDNED